MFERRIKECPLMTIVVGLDFIPTKSGEFFRGSIQKRLFSVLWKDFQVCLVKASIDTGNETIFIAQERENMFQYIQILIEWKG